MLGVKSVTLEQLAERTEIIYRSHGRSDGGRADVGDEKFGRILEKASLPTRGRGDADLHYVRITPDMDTSLVIGRRGRNRARIERATRCSIRKEGQDTHFEIRGPRENAKTAEYLIKTFTAPLVGRDMPVRSYEIQNNCSCLEIPKETTRMVVGKGGSHVTSLEEQNDTVMFLASIVDQKKNYHTNTLLIFGERSGRRLSQLIVMALVESIVAGTYTKPWYDNRTTFDAEADLDGDWGTTVRELQDNDEAAYVIGRRATRRDKLMRASGCVIAKIDKLLFMSGTKQQRAYAEEYLDFLLDGLDRHVGYVNLCKPEERKDCNLMTVPEDCVEHVNGLERSTLNRIEETCGVLVLMLTERPSPGEQTFAILGPDRARCGALFLLQELVENQSPGYVTENISEGRSDEVDFGVDYLQLDSGEASHVWGREGEMERTLAVASNALIHFIRNVCCIGGNINERRRCHDYIEWLLFAFRGETLIPKFDQREDITQIAISEMESRLIPHSELQHIGQETDTLLFFIRTLEGRHAIMVCGHDQGEQWRLKGRARAQWMVHQAMARDAKPHDDENWPPSKAARHSHDDKIVPKSWRVFVAGLPAECTRGILRGLCQQICSESGLSVDELVDCSVKPEKGCGWLELSSRSAGEVVIQELHQREVRGWEEPLRARWTIASWKLRMTEILEA